MGLLRFSGRQPDNKLGKVNQNRRKRGPDPEEWGKLDSESTYHIPFMERWKQGVIRNAPTPWSLDIEFVFDAFPSFSGQVVIIQHVAFSGSSDNECPEFIFLLSSPHLISRVFSSTLAILWLLQDRWLVFGQRSLLGGHIFWPSFSLSLTNEHRKRPWFLSSLWEVFRSSVPLAVHLW